MRGCSYYKKKNVTAKELIIKKINQFTIVFFVARINKIIRCRGQGYGVYSSSVRMWVENPAWK